MNLFALPPSWVAVAALTLVAMIILVSAVRLSRDPAAVSALGVLGALLAALPALGSPSPETPAVLGITALAALAFLLLPNVDLELDTQRPEVAALLLIGSAGAIVLATAGDLLSLTIGLETLSLSVAIATALGRGDRPLEAAFKYFVLAALSLAIMVYGIGLYTLATGSLSLAARPPADPTLQFLYAAGVIMVALGFAFELAVAPLHWGALSAYLAAPPGLAGYIMSASKLAAVLALSRLVAAVGPAAPVAPILVGIGVLSIGWGTFAALAQRDLRGLLAYSAIAHAGFLALAVGSGPDGRLAAVFYVVTYAATAILVFAALASLGNGPLSFDRLRGLGPFRGVALALGLLSLAGIPPTPGFWAKLAILGPAWVVAGPLPTLVAVVGGVAGALYYLRPLPDLFASIRARVAAQRPAGSTSAAVALAGALVVVFGLVPGLAWVLAGRGVGG